MLKDNRMNMHKSNSTQGNPKIDLPIQAAHLRQKQQQNQHNKPHVQFKHRELISAIVDYSLKPKRKITIYKKPFSNEEDQIILDFVGKDGPRNWNLISTRLDDRTPKQCRERWHNHLNPSIKKGPWTEYEDIEIAKKHRQYGNRWAEIAKYLPGRTDTLIKNRWNTSLKQRTTYEQSGKIKIEPVQTGMQKLWETGESTKEVSEGDDQISLWLEELNKNIRLDDLYNMPPLIEKKTE